MSSAEPRPAAGFSPAQGADVRPPAQPVRRRLAYLALAAANRIILKTPDKVVLHSTIDVEDGVLALADELNARGWTPTILLERPSRADRVQRHAQGHVRTVPNKSARGVLEFLTARFAFT